MTDTRTSRLGFTIELPNRIHHRDASGNTRSATFPPKAMEALTTALDSLIHHLGYEEAEPHGDELISWAFHFYAD